MIMKKIFIAIAFCVMCVVNIFGQITIGNTGSSKIENYLIKGMYYNIKCYNDTLYILNVKDLESTEFIRIHLGNNKDEAKNSLIALYDWFKDAKTKDYIEFTSVNGVVITMYKYTSTVPYFSEGDIEYMKNYISKTIMQGIFGAPYRRRANDKMVGCIDDISQFKKAIKHLDE